MISENEAKAYLEELKEYMESNGEDPEKIGKTFFEVYWSKAQVSTITVISKMSSFSLLILYKYNYFIYNAWVENICDLNVLSTLQ